MTLLRLTDIEFGWHEQHSATWYLDRLEVQRGERVFLQGPSGSGKSSLLYLIAGLLLPRRGQVEVLGHGLHRMRSWQRDRFRARHIGIIFQQFNLIPYLSAIDNVRLGLQLAGRPADRAHCGDLLLQLGLDAAAQQATPGQLSVGQQQRVALARTLALGPELILADEPTSALDEEHRLGFMRLLLKICQETGSGLLLVSHDPRLTGLCERQLETRHLLQRRVPC